MGLLTYIFGKRPSITYAITVCNERREIKLLLDELLPKIRQKDEVLVLQDITQKDQAVSDILHSYGDRIHLAESKLAGDFARFKNTLIGLAKGDYLFQIDADERLPESLVDGLPAYLELKSKYDCLSVSRINTVKGITEERLKEWKWEMNSDGYINFPDWQPRIIKLHTAYPIKWKNKVHEVIHGHQKMGRVKGNGYEMSLIHEKEIKKQEAQNSFYEDNF